MGNFKSSKTNQQQNSLSRHYLLIPNNITVTPPYVPSPRWNSSPKEDQSFSIPRLPRTGRLCFGTDAHTALNTMDNRMDELERLLNSGHRDTTSLDTRTYYKIHPEKLRMKRSVSRNMPRRLCKQTIQGESDASEQHNMQQRATPHATPQPSKDQQRAFQNNEVPSDENIPRIRRRRRKSKGSAPFVASLPTLFEEDQPMQPNLQSTIIHREPIISPQAIVNNILRSRLSGSTEPSLSPLIPIVESGEDTGRTQKANFWSTSRLPTAVENFNQPIDAQKITILQRPRDGTISAKITTVANSPSCSISTKTSRRFENTTTSQDSSSKPLIPLQRATRNELSTRREPIKDESRVSKSKTPIQDPGAGSWGSKTSKSSTSATSLTLSTSSKNSKSSPKITQTHDRKTCDPKPLTRIQSPRICSWPTISLTTSPKRSPVPKSRSVNTPKTKTATTQHVRSSSWSSSSSILSNRTGTQPIYRSPESQSSSRSDGSVTSNLSTATTLAPTSPQTLVTGDTSPRFCTPTPWVHPATQRSPRLKDRDAGQKLLTPEELAIAMKLWNYNGRRS